MASGNPITVGSTSGSASHDSCRFATPADIAQASGLPVTQARPLTDREGEGCYYVDNSDFNDVNYGVKVHLASGAKFDEDMSKIHADRQVVVRDVPDLGQQAAFITAANPGQYGGELYVKASAAQAFTVRTTQESHEDAFNSELAIAKLLIPRM